MTKRCAKCGVRKKASAFTPHATSRRGLTASCKKCRAEVSAARRGRLQADILFPSGETRAQSRYVGTRSCGLCGNDFEPKRKKQTLCKDCGVYFRKTWSLLTSGRSKGGVRAKRRRLSKAVVEAVCRRRFQATHCIYCGRPFGEKRKKHLDHDPPLCKGGRFDDPDQIFVSCEDCNRSKAWLTYSEWLELCKAVVAHAKRSRQ